MNTPTKYDYRPRAGRITDAVAHSGVSRARLYEWAARYPELFKKNGKSVIVDYDVLDRIIDALPQAAIKPPRARGAKAEEAAA
jgi:hypothetical protein